MPNRLEINRGKQKWAQIQKDFKKYKREIEAILQKYDKLAERVSKVAKEYSKAIREE